MPSLRSVRLPGRSAAALVLAAGVTQLALVVSGPMSVRLLGVEGRGELAVLVAVTVFASQLGALGVPAAYAYLVSREHLTARALLRLRWRRDAARVVLVAGAAVGLYAVLTRVGEVAGGTPADLVLVGCGTAAVGATLVGFAGLQGEQRFRPLAVLQSAPALWYAAGLVVLLLLGAAQVSTVAAVYVAGWAGAAAVALLLVTRRPGAGRADDATQVSAPRLRTYASRALVVSAAPVDGLAIDQLVLGAMVSRADLGLYVVGLAFATACAGPLVAVSTLVTPRLAALDRAAARALATRWLLLALAAALAGVLLLQLVVGTVLPWAFGADARPAVPTARVLVLAGAVLGLRRVGAAVLLGLGRPGGAAAAEVVGLVVLLVALPVAATAGTVEAALALCSAGSAACLAQLVALRRTER